MSFLTPIEPEDASPEILRIYESGEKRSGVLFNNWKQIAQSPKILRGYTQFVGAMLNPDNVEKRILELGILKVTLINRCRY